MKRTITFISFLAAFFTAYTSSGGNVGNGGFVIKCGETTQLFDYYQAEIAGTHVLQNPGKNLNDKVEYLLKRLETIDPNRAKNYRFQFKYWNDQPELPIEGIHLNSMQAADPRLQKAFGLGPVSIPQNCELILAVQQLFPKLDSTGSAQLQVQRFGPVWNSLDLDTKAGLVLHELFYEEYLLRQAQPPTSESVRKLNGLLGSKEFLKFTKAEWIKELWSQRYSPIFPDFNNEKTILDISYRKGPHPSDYLIFPLGSTTRDWFDGTISVCGKSVHVGSNTNLFHDGLIPALSFSKNNGPLDLSCYSDTGTLIFDSRGIGFEYIRTTSSGQSVLMLRHTGEWYGPWSTPIPGSDYSSSYLKVYSNPHVRTIGPIITGITWNQRRNAMILTLKKTQFSDIQVNVSGQWTIVNEYCWIDLATGEIFNIDCFEKAGQICEQS
ncbi:MAG: hypothetical protein AB7F59_05690 [Bdellovibrionales bacterium]